MKDLIHRNTGNHKYEILEYYRNRSSELIGEAKQIFSDAEYKERASLVNKGLIKAKANLIKILEQRSKNESWEPKQILKGVLTITYANYREDFSKKMYSHLKNNNLIQYLEW